jgi:transposase-like protein
VPRLCLGCHHEERLELDRAIAKGTGSIRQISERFGIGSASVIRHRKHVSSAITLAAVEDAKVTRRVEALSVLDKMRAAEVDLRRLVRKAEADQDVRAAVGGMKVLMDLFGTLMDIEERHEAATRDIEASVVARLDERTVQLKDRLVAWILAKHPAELPELVAVLRGEQPAVTTTAIALVEPGP